MFGEGRILHLYIPVEEVLPGDRLTLDFTGREVKFVACLPVDENKYAVVYSEHHDGGIGQDTLFFKKRYRLNVIRLLHE